MEVRLQKVTPAIADNYLRFNVKNRKVSAKTLLFLSKQMTDDSFYENGESIIFDLNGNLVDGQHRLLAIIKSGKSYTIPIVTGVLPDSMATYDTGKNRTAADLLGMHGFKYQQPISSFIIAVDKYKIRGLKSFVLGSGDRPGYLTNQQVLEFCKDNYEWIEPMVSISYSYNSKQTPIILSTTQIALISYMIGGKYPSIIVYDFVKNIIGLSRTSGSATNYLFTKLYNSKINNEPLSFYWILGMAIRAYNYYIDGDPAVRSYSFKISSDLPKIN